VRIDVLTLFPGMFAGPFDESIVARARARRPDLLAGAAAILAADSDAVKEND